MEEAEGGLSLVARASRALGLYRGLPKSVYVLFATTVVNGLGTFVFPFMTLLLTKRLGYTDSQAGMVMMVSSLAYLPGAILGGKLADRFGRKKVMAITQALSVAALVPCGFLGDSPLVVAFIMASLLFDGLTDPARSAMQTDITNPGNRQAAFSLLYLGHNLGFAGGPLIAGFLFNAAPQWMFWGNAIAAFLALSLVIAFVPETKPTDAQIEASLETDSTEKAVKGGIFKALLSRPYLLVYVAITTLYGFAYAQHRFLIPLQTDALFGAAGATLYGLLMTMNAVLVVIFNIPLVALLRRFRPIVNTALAGFLYALGFGMLAFAGAPWAFFVSAFLWTMGEIVDATNSQVYVANHTPMSHRARFNAVLPIIWGLGWTVSTPISGAMSDRVGLGPTWLLVGAAAALAACGLLVLDRAERSRAKTTGGTEV